MVREWGGVGMHKWPTEFVSKTKVGMLRYVRRPSVRLRGGVAHMNGSGYGKGRTKVIW